MPILHQLRLRGFRNYSRLDSSYRPGVNLLVGGNGQGKTNLLEAIYFLSLLRSFRTSRIGDLCGWGRGSFFVGGRIGKADGSGTKAGLAVGVGKVRRMRVDGRQIHRASEFIDHFHCVALVPEDIRLIRGPAAERRRFLDILLSQGDRRYLRVLGEYKRLIKYRNTMLRNSRRFGLSAIAAFDEQLLSTGTALIRARVRLMERLKIWVVAEWAGLSEGAGGELSVEYKSMLCKGTGCGDDGDDGGMLMETFRRMLADTIEQDLKEGWTRVGPHRDDILISLNGRKLSAFGSEGQCRRAAIALRLASICFLAGNGSDEVVVLVDDVLGELDRERRIRFVHRLSACAQVLLALTEVPHWLDKGLAVGYRVEDGVLSPMTG